MKHKHMSFWIELAGSLGPSVFAGTMVACLLADRFLPSHFILLGGGIFLIALNHWYKYHHNVNSE